MVPVKVQKNKQEEYAKRIIAGEPPEQVLQGQKPNGAVWNLVMQRVAKLKQQQQPQQPQIKLSDFEDKVGDINWHSLYEIFVRQHSRNQNDPKVMQLGQALYQAAQSNNMSVIQPFVQQYLKAQRIS